MQSEFPLWTDVAPLSFVLALIGCILISVGRIIEGPILNKMLAHGIGGREGIEDTIYHESSFSLQCWSLYQAKTIVYERTIIVLKVAGGFVLSSGALIYLWGIYLALAIGVVFLIQLFVFQNVRVADLKERAIRRLDEWNRPE